MKKGILLILTFFILSSGYYSFRINTGTLYDQYKKTWEYRILHPEILPDSNFISLGSAGHKRSYADFLWIRLIQYIGDNISGQRYYSFLNPFVEKISELHPHFTEIYNITLILAPRANQDNPQFAILQQITRESLRIGEIGLKNNCEEEKLKGISKIEFGVSLWENIHLKNPCSDHFLAYNLAITANELGEYKKAKEYFKIASAQEDSPKASRFLGPLMDSKLGDFKSAGERFLLMAVDAYDEPPYTCRNIASELLKKYKSGAYSELIKNLRKNEDALPDLKDTDNPLATSGNTCKGFTIRAMKQFYLSYITDISVNYPEIVTGSGLIEKGILDKIPSIKDQDDWKLIKKDGLWRYSE